MAFGLFTKGNNNNKDRKLTAKNKSQRKQVVLTARQVKDCEKHEKKSTVSSTNIVSPQPIAPPTLFHPPTSSTFQSPRGQRSPQLHYENVQSTLVTLSAPHNVPVSPNIDATRYQKQSPRSKPLPNFQITSALRLPPEFPRPVIDDNREISHRDLATAVHNPLQTLQDGTAELQRRGHSILNQAFPLSDLICSRFDAVITSIDGEIFSGDERELVIHSAPETALRGGSGLAIRDVSRAAKIAITTAVQGHEGINYFAKANLYANSRLPPSLPALRLYLPAYPLICLAAQYSQKVYVKPTGKEVEAHVGADWRTGTKAMVIKSVPLDDMSAVVFAIRGSQTFMDWAVNLQSAPSSPVGFLDDLGNLCHTGFLSVARKMIKPVAAALRSFLEEDPSRSSCSLIMTGHSAGGAVASLLYAHMLAAEVESELNILTGCFKRIHCITFGAPPVSLLPLRKPKGELYKKSLFLSFINEGDPVPRADKAYVRSLFELYASHTPGHLSSPANLLAVAIPKPQQPRANRRSKVPWKPLRAPAIAASFAPVWHVPPGALSNAGNLVVLRTGSINQQDDLSAEITTDQQLRGVVFGDPLMHMMKVYAWRVEVLATRAVTAKVWG